MRDNSIETMRRQSAPENLICSGGRVGRISREPVPAAAKPFCGRHARLYNTIALANYPLVT